MNKYLAAVNFIVLLILSGCVLRLFIDKGQKLPVQSVVRTERLEIVDRYGHVDIALGEKELGAYPSEMAFYDSTGRPAILILVDKTGHGTIFFQSKQTEGKVAVGALNDSDVEMPSSDKEGVFSWGMQVRAKNGHSIFTGLSDLDQPLK